MVIATGAGFLPSSGAQAQHTNSPLTITNKPAPPAYDQPIETRNTENEALARSWPHQRHTTASQNQLRRSRSAEGVVSTEKTRVSKKVRSLRSEYREIAETVKKLRERLYKLEDQTRTRSDRYFADVAALNTQLQTGTTPGNPRLKRRLNAARSNLVSLSQITADLSALSEDLEDVSSRASVLMENVRAAYSISGAIEEDHEALTRLEDDLQDLLITIDRTQKKVSDSMTRMRTYLSSESSNLRTLSMAVTNGNFYGRSLSYRPFSRLSQSGSASRSDSRTLKRQTRLQAQEQAGRLQNRSKRESPIPGKRRVMKIRFTNPNVKYEQALFNAISDVQERYPDASFELVAVHPEDGNNARSVIQSTRARRNAEEVLRKMREMGLPARDVELSRRASKSASSSEVHIYLRNS